MTLSASRIVFSGETPYAYERDAIQHVIQCLPNTDPFHVWALLELPDPATGRLYEIDLLVLGYSALYHIEIKSGPGRYSGDHQDWYRTAPEDDRPRYMENPYRLANHKAKVLATRLRTKLANPKSAPWVEPLIFLSAPGVELRFTGHGDMGVVTRDTLLRAVQHGDYPGANAAPRPRISAPVARDVAQALKALGARPRKGKLQAGAYELGDIVEEGPGYQDRAATHRQQRSITCRARTYLVPQQTSVEDRQRLVRAADRESQLLWDVREHPNVLRIAGYETDAPLGPTVLFDPFEGGVPLPTFLRQTPDLEFLDRVTIIEQLARALSFCHKKQIFHGGLCPEAVLVRRHPDTGAIETRLFNFQLGASAKVEATSHWSALASDRWAIYQAPELREDATARSSLSDVYSLGAVAYFLFTGRPPGESFVEVARRLSEHRELDPRAVDDGVPQGVANAICFATALSPIQRADDAAEWLELLLDETTRPTPPPTQPELDPLEARKDDRLGTDLRVDAILGQGATARVLRVERDSDPRPYALKVPLSAEHAERLADEAETLTSLRHPRIVQLVERRVLAGRPCLLLSLAGTETLHRYLAREGTVSLDLAARYGDDLLAALEHLEDEQVLHRDIKPANIGVGSVGKGAARLTLFDFSLARASLAELQVGTAAYRDPYLSLRGAWDGAAERWSVAITFHEMLTGARPVLSGTALDASSRLELAAERFDPSVRDALVDFFTRALARDAEQRFPSAKAMRRAWTEALDSSEHPRALTPHPASGDGSEEADPSPVGDEVLAAITPDALVETLPLSARAKNALDRAGAVHARDLADLPDNRISAVRGVGRKVAREILDLRARWLALRGLGSGAATPFVAGYRGDDSPLQSTPLDTTLANALSDAGLPTLGAVAAAPHSQIAALAERAGLDIKALRALLDAENRAANERARPSTIEGWIDALLPKRAHMKHPRLLFGLEGPRVDVLGLTVRELAGLEELTSAAIYIALNRARAAWAKHPAIEELRQDVHTLLDAASGAAPLRDAARFLLARIPHDRLAPATTLDARAAALVRVIAELDKEEDDGIRYLRIADQPWICASDAHAAAARELGRAADALAARDVVAGQGETARAFAEAASGTPLADAPPGRLAEIAAAASDRAARSSRLEIYPRGMSADRALALSASLLKSELTPDDVVRRVALRYPDAQPLPSRPALDSLLLVHGLTWSEETGKYYRPGSSDRTSLHTRSHSSLPRFTTALPTQALSMDPEAVVARQFDERLRNAIERRYLRILGVRADRAQKAALTLAERLQVRPIAFDRELIAEMRAQMKRGGIRNDDIVHAADREGRRGKSWPNLLRLAEAAAESLANRLLPPKEPLLLIQLGPLARYRLDAFRARLLEASRAPDAASILLLIPSHDTGGPPRLEGEPPLPGLLASQAMWIPAEWIGNRHNAAA